MTDRLTRPSASGLATRPAACGFAVASLLVTLTVTACNQPPAVNPWREDAIAEDAWSTPSRDGILALAREPAIREREIPHMDAPHVNPGVPHYPLWWEDPLEDKGDQDGAFAWTWQDYVAMPYSLGRLLLNTMAWPVSATVTPPGTPMVSDGVTGRDHDATRGTSPDPLAGPGDFCAAAP